MQFFGCSYSFEIDFTIIFVQSTGSVLRFEFIATVAGVYTYSAVISVLNMVKKSGP